MPIVYILAVVIVLVPIVLRLKGFKPKWYHFLFFPVLFIFLMSTYDILKPWWEQVMFTDPWASAIFAFSIALAMFIFWVSTFKED